MSPHLALSIGAAASMLQIAAPMRIVAAAQGFDRKKTAANAYQIAVVHDRVTDSSRVSASFTATSKPFGLDSRAWLDLSFAFPGARLVTPPPAVVLTIESWTPARGGWAFAHPERLRIESGDSIRLEFPAAGYLKRRVHLFDTGRREVLWFDIPSSDFTRLAGAPELIFRAGRARFRVRERMEMLHEVLRRMTPLERGSP
ncbi:MAG: hypothetical protein ACJ8DC_12545 [Gemmatimonadales bacterium]